MFDEETAGNGLNVPVSFSSSNNTLASFQEWTESALELKLFQFEIVVGGTLNTS